MENKKNVKNTSAPKKGPNKKNKNKKYSSNKQNTYPIMEEALRKAGLIK